MNKKNVSVPDHEPPQGYICYRCGEKGHWIQLCPTNDNPEYDNRPRVKRTTGIPKSFLKTVDKATALGQNADGDEAKTPSGIMVNADGEFVIAEPDKASWEQFQAKAKSNASAQKAASEGDKEVRERGLECPIDKKMFIDPMKTPCCEKTYCNDCITNALIESDFVCPGCKTEGVLIDDLKADEEAVEKMKTYLAEKDSKAKEGPKSPMSPSAGAKSPNGATKKEGSNSPALATSSAGSQNTQASTSITTPHSITSTPANGDNMALGSKKRPAEDVAENPRIPKAPKAMQKQETQQANNLVEQMMLNGMGAMNPMAGMGAMNGMPMMFPGMPMMPGNYGPGPGGMGMPNINMNPMMNGMMNPMMGGGYPGTQGMNGNGGMWGGGPGGPDMSMGMGMGGMNGMGMPGMNMGGGMNGVGGPANNMNMNHMNGGGPPHMNGMNGMNGHQNSHHNNNPNMGMGMNGGFQQQNHNNMPFHPGHRNFTNQPAADEDAYFRKPVNPHRHQNRARRARPSDYREL